MVSPFVLPENALLLLDRNADEICLHFPQRTSPTAADGVNLPARNPQASRRRNFPKFSNLREKKLKLVPTLQGNLHRCLFPLPSRERPARLLLRWEVQEGSELTVDSGFHHAP